MRRSFCLVSFLSLGLPLSAAAQDPVVEQVDAAGASFPVVTAGEGEPIVFVHGSLSDYRAWDGIRDAVAKDHRFIAYTQRHFGASEWPDEPGFSRDVHEADLVALLDTWAEPMHLVGWSYGGPIALQAAQDRPASVRRLALYEPALGSILDDKPEYEQLLAERQGVWGPMIEEMKGGDNERATRLAIEYFFGLPEGGFETLPEGARTMWLENADTLPLDFAAPEPTPMTCDDLRSIEAPVLILYGSDTLPYFEAIAKEVAACLPNATLEEMPGAGHGAPVQQGDAVISKMLAFIDAEAG